MILLDSIYFGLTKSHLVISYTVREDTDEWLLRAEEAYEAGAHWGSPGGSAFYCTLQGAQEAYHAGVWDKKKQQQVWLPLLLLPVTLLALIVIIKLKGGLSV